MAKHGFRVMDSDLHVVEPRTLWENYLDPKFTDWPHDDSRVPHAIDSFLGQADLSETSKRKVLWDNCARLYKL